MTGDDEHGTDIERWRRRLQYASFALAVKAVAALAYFSVLDLWHHNLRVCAAVGWALAGGYWFLALFRVFLEWRWRRALRAARGGQHGHRLR